MKRTTNQLGLVFALVLLQTTHLLSTPRSVYSQSLPNQCAVPGKDGVDNGVINVVNSYYGGPSSDTTLSSGATSIPVGKINLNGNQTTIAPGDLLLIIQMQDADINFKDSANYGSGSAGNNGAGTTGINQTGVYEYVVATNSVGANGGVVQIRGTNGGGLNYSYRQAAADIAVHGQRTYQVIRVPQFISTTLTGTIRSPGAWNGSSGGVVAIDVAKTFTFAGGTVDVRDKGFRGGGGTQNNNDYPAVEDESYRTDGGVPRGGVKGEGIAGTPRYVFDDRTIANQASTDTGIDGYPRLKSEDTYVSIGGNRNGGSRGRGAPGNAGGGGNMHNSGGGGGSNAGAGGNGGMSINPPDPSEIPEDGISKPVGGRGGAAYTPTPNRLIMGGGGGAGDANNGFAGSGGLGGGIVIIRAGSVTGSGTINARAKDGIATPTDDGGSGAGAGGSILVIAKSGSLSNIALNADGGQGGNTNTADPSIPYDFGPGGGGGGGVIFSSVPLGVATANGGVAGRTFNGQLGGTAGVNRGATPGSNGQITSGVTSSQIPGIKSGAECAITISGTVWHDADTNLTINNSESGTNAGSSLLTVYAINTTTGKVVDKAAVTSNGTYTLSLVPTSSTNLKLRLSNSNTAVIGDDAPLNPSLPTGWFHTGESLNGTLDPVIATVGDIALSTTTTDITNYNFGIRQSYIIPATPAPTTCTPDFRTTINTGIGLNGLKLPKDSKDLHWTAEWIAGPSGGYKGVPYATPRPVGIMPAVVTGNLATGAWIPDLTNAQWISYPFRLTNNSDGNHQDANLDNSNNQYNDTIRIKYRATINLPLNARNISVSVPVGVSVDNYFLSATVNGTENIPTTAAKDAYTEDYRVLNSFNLDKGWKPGSNAIEIVTDSGPPLTGFFLSINATTAQICGKANVQILKRVTGIRTANGTYGNTNPNDSTPLIAIDNTNTSFPVDYIVGSTNGGTVKPGDEIEYTVYYVNKGGNPAKLKVCDLLDKNLVFNPNGFDIGTNTGHGIQLKLGQNTPLLLTSINDPTVDRAYYLNGIPPASLTGCNLPTNTANSSGTVVVDLTNDSTTSQPINFPSIPGVELYSIPNNSYGSFKFRAKVKS